MFGSLNKVQLIGTLGADPDIKSFQNGGRIANLRVACSESWKDKTTGERKERTEWVSVSVQQDGLVGLVERFLKKGSKVYVEGKLQTRKWQDQGGNDRYSTEVVIRPFAGEIIKLDKKDGDAGSGSGAGGRSGGSQGGGGSGWGQGSGGRAAGSGASQDGNQGGAFGSGRSYNEGGGGGGGFGGGGFGDDLDDDIPFITCDVSFEGRVC